MSRKTNPFLFSCVLLFLSLHVVFLSGLSWTWGGRRKRSRFPPPPPPPPPISCAVVSACDSVSFAWGIGKPNTHPPPEPPFPLPPPPNEPISHCHRARDRSSPLRPSGLPPLPQPSPPSSPSFARRKKGTNEFFFSPFQALMWWWKRRNWNGAPSRDGETKKEEVDVREDDGTQTKALWFAEQASCVTFTISMSKSTLQKPT